MPHVPGDDDGAPKPAWVQWSDSVWIAFVVLGLLLVARGLA
jgi:hypothetical protein